MPKPLALALFLFALFAASCVQPPTPPSQTISGDDMSDMGDVAEMSIELDASQDQGPCVPESNADFCVRTNSECGMTDARDNCGNARLVDCGGCELDAICAQNTCDCPTPTCDPAMICGEVSNGCGSTASCGEGCPEGSVCVQGSSCCEGESKAALCDRAGVACGVIEVFDMCDQLRQITCGECAAGQTCDTGGQCVCAPETDTKLCENASATCDAITVEDRCGATRTINCGTCAAGSVCGNNACSCVPETDDEICAAEAAQCGSVTATDRCGDNRMVQCSGVCANGEQCQPDNTCPTCIPESKNAFCIRNSATCGELTAQDNCGDVRTEQCGGCDNASQQCDGSNQCVCTPETDAAFCSRLGVACGAKSANDNCGTPRTVSECGACAHGEECNTSGQCVCEVVSDVEFCTANNADCGQFTGMECGAARTVMCGGCAMGSMCNGQNECTCAPESDAAFCSRLAAQCGNITAADNCGANRTTNCGGCSNGQTCEANKCETECMAPSDSAICSMLNRDCGVITHVDVCNTTRTIDCGTCSGYKNCVNATANHWTCEEQHIDDPSQSKSTRFGHAVDVHDSVAIVGARSTTPRTNNAVGEAFVLEKSPSGLWTMNQPLTAPTPGYNNSMFGHAVAIDSERAIVGIPSDSKSFGNVSLDMSGVLPEAGVTAFYSASAGGMHTQVLQSSDAQEEGWAVAIHEDGGGNSTSASGAPTASMTLNDYVIARKYDNASSTWNNNPSRRIVSTSTNVSFGAALAMTNTKMAIGVPESDRMLLCTRNNSAAIWTCSTAVTPSTPTSSGHAFGTRVALSHDGALLAVTTLPYNPHKSMSADNGGSGSVTLFDTSTTNEIATFSIATASSDFGLGLGLVTTPDATHLVIGDPEFSSGAGRVLVFKKAHNATNWPTTPTTFITPTSMTMGARFGESIATHEHTLIIGAPQSASGTSGDPVGRVYFYTAW